MKSNLQKIAGTTKDAPHRVLIALAKRAKPPMFVKNGEHTVRAKVPNRHANIPVSKASKLRFTAALAAIPAMPKYVVQAHGTLTGGSMVVPRGMAVVFLTFPGASSYNGFEHRLGNPGFLEQVYEGRATIRSTPFPATYSVMYVAGDRMPNISVSPDDTSFLAGVYPLPLPTSMVPVRMKSGGYPLVVMTSSPHQIVSIDKPVVLSTLLSKFKHGGLFVVNACRALDKPRDLKRISAMERAVRQRQLQRNIPRSNRYFELHYNSNENMNAQYEYQSTWPENIRRNAADRAASRSRNTLISWPVGVVARRFTKAAVALRKLKARGRPLVGEYWLTADIYAAIMILPGGRRIVRLSRKNLATIRVHRQHEWDLVAFSIAKPQQALVAVAELLLLAREAFGQATLSASGPTILVNRDEADEAWSNRIRREVRVALPA